MMKVFVGTVALMLVAGAVRGEAVQQHIMLEVAPVREGSALDRIGELLNLEETKRPWSTTTTVQVAPVKGVVEPFVAVAHESFVNDERARLGYGAGARVKVSRNASLVAEVLHFSGETARMERSVVPEMRAMVRLQIEF
jgi:hypothetical protein